MLGRRRLDRTRRRIVGWVGGDGEGGWVGGGDGGGGWVGGGDGGGGWVGGGGG